MTAPHALSPLDAVFLHVESERTPMHMASVAIFEAGPLQDATGELRIGDIRRLISWLLISDRVHKAAKVER